MEVGSLGTAVSRQYLEEVCVVCDERRAKGIHLYTSFICSECEEDMVRTDTRDPKYKYYIDRLKKITTPEIYS
nr:sigma factor G inhibitor Gin [Falsibacillus pallidus]